MNFDDLKILWDQEKTRPVYTLDEEALHRLVERRAAAFKRSILLRDSVEIGVGILLVLLFVSRALVSAGGGGGALSLLSVAHLVLALGVAFVCGFLFVSRQRQKARESGCADTVQGNLRRLISNVSYQGRLLGRVAWWYLLPVVPGVVLFIAATADSGPLGPWTRGILIALVFGWVYWLNRRAVRKHLLPQKREFESLLARLENG